jgi:malonyl-CoA/methylmalonyl-CoA synthetase
MFFGVPTMYQRLIQQTNVSDMRTLRLCVSGSAPLAPTLFSKFYAASGLEPLERYGATEVLMAISNPYDGKRKPGKVGIPLPGVEIRLAEDGEVLVRSPMVFSRYWNRDIETTESLVDGWYHTGDIATQDDDGYFEIVGRSKELIISGGMNVYPKEIEQIIGQVDGVLEVGVIGLSSREWGEQVTALVVPNAVDSQSNDELEEAISAVCKEQLAPYKRPKKILFTERLPRNSLGKLIRSELAGLIETQDSGYVVYSSAEE